MSDADAPLSIVYQDQQLVVFDKPTGLLAVPGKGPDLQDCLSVRAIAYFPTALVVHRLDRDTSGLMLMALDPSTQRELNRQFAARTVFKRYVAVVYGTPTECEGVIDRPMRKDFDNPPRHMIDDVQGRPARTAWRLCESRAGDNSVAACRLDVIPSTGRSHQIRLHLATIGHPILGDNLYAHPQALAMADRLLLHAAELAVTHPATGLEMRWHSLAPF